MDVLLKNCNTEHFKVGDKVRIRQDIGNLVALWMTDIDRYTRIFPNKIQTGHSRYKITSDMIASAGKTAEVIEVIQGPPKALLLSTLYRLRINGSNSEWCWKHALLEKVEEDVEADGSKWKLPFKVGTKVKITPNLKSSRHKDFDIKGKCYRDVGVIDIMERYKGKEATITSVNKVDSDVIGGGYAYLIEVDGEETGWNWDISMFCGFDKWLFKQREQEEQKEECQFPLEVGDLVEIRKDFKERVDKNGFIWSTINGRRYKSFWCSAAMQSNAGRIAKITEVRQHENHIGDFAYRLKFIDGKETDFDYDISMFGCFNDWIDWKFGGSKKKDKAKKKNGNCFFEHKPVVELPPFCAYDYKGRKREFESFSGKITKIEVTIISGDETGLVYLVDNGKSKRIAFDASHGSRFISYDDGSYVVEGDEQLQRWLSWSYDKDKAKNVNYAIQHMADFLGGDK